VTSAHAVGFAGGPSIEILVVAAGMLVLGVVLFLQKTAKPAVVILLLAAGLVMGVVSFALGGSSDVHVAITSPEDGATVPADKRIELDVKLTGATLTTGTTASGDTAGHLHVFVDDDLHGMPSETTVPLKLAPGRHTVVVEFTNADHSSLSPRVIDEIVVTAE
jgi:hypothetical protein